MRMLLNVKLPHETFNAAVRDGSAGKKLKRILDELKPEAVYFTEQEGHRGATLGTFTVGTTPAGVAFDGASIWVANFGGTTVSKL